MARSTSLGRSRSARLQGVRQRFLVRLSCIDWLALCDDTHLWLRCETSVLAKTAARLRFELLAQYSCLKGDSWH